MHRVALSVAKDVAHRRFVFQLFIEPRLILDIGLAAINANQINLAAAPQDGASGRLVPVLLGVVRCVVIERNLHLLHLPSQLLRQRLDGVGDDLVVEGLHAFAADLEVEARVGATAVLDDPLGEVFAEHVWKRIFRDGFVDHGLPNSVCRDDHVVVAGHLRCVDLLDVFAQVIPIRALLPVNKRDLVVPTLDRHRDDALQGEVEPLVGLVDEGGGWHSVCRAELRVLHGRSGGHDARHRNAEVLVARLRQPTEYALLVFLRAVQEQRLGQQVLQHADSGF